MPDTFRLIEDVDTTYLRFDPNDPHFVKKMKEEIPAFAEYSVEYIDTDSARRRVYAWIVLMYDVNSPLRREIKDMYKRKVYAANLCSIKPNPKSGKYRECYENIFTGQDKKANDLIVKFISSFASPEYKQLMAHAAIQDSMMEKIVAGKADKNTQLMFDTSTEKVKELTNFIYGSGERDEVYEARRALYKQVAYDLSDMRPETVSRTVVEDGKLPDDWNPYEEGYQPEDIHFIGDDISVAADDEEALP
jgi:hypothetical protein